MLQLPPKIRTTSPTDVFLSYVEERDGCWIWDGPITETGYGHACYRGRKERAHRLAYMLFKGPIPDGIHVLHQCDVRNCVNPAHLRLGTHAENMADMMLKGRHVARNGERAGGAKLKAQQVVAIRKDDRIGRLIAAQYGVSKSLIEAIRRRKVWRHLP